MALFKAQFPPVLIDATEWVKHLSATDSEPLQRFVATTSGALIGVVVVSLFAVLMHLILGDRRFVDSLRFTAVSLIPVAVMNGLLSHGVQTLVNQEASQSLESLEMGVLIMPWVYFALNVVFYLTSLWATSRRTGVKRERRGWLLAAGLVGVALYLAAGLMILPGEWQALIAQAY